MPFELHPVTEADFPEVVRCMWDTYENPEQDLFRIFCPLNEVGATDRESAIEKSTSRFWEWHTADPTSYWQRVVDTEAGNKIVGAVLWKINSENPFEKVEHHQAYWHPEGGQREFASQALWQHEAVRERCARRPHVYLAIIYMHPLYQRKGGGRLILEWGIAKAKEMGVEMWLDGWRYGRPVYEQFGFTTVEQHKLKPESEQPDEAWKTCEREWTDLEEWIMWRPKDGPYVEGKSVRPWEAP